jgi:hypothetical protein
MSWRTVTQRYRITVVVKDPADLEDAGNWLAYTESEIEEKEVT